MFGRPKHHTGSGGTFRATDVPLALLQDLRQFPIPITISGTNNVTFTIKGTTRPVVLWTEDDIIEMKKDVLYTWNATSNPILNSDGEETTDTDSVLGVWYMYVYM